MQQSRRTAVTAYNYARYIMLCYTPKALSLVRCRGTRRINRRFGEGKLSMKIIPGGLPDECDHSDLQFRAKWNTLWHMWGGALRAIAFSDTLTRYLRFNELPRLAPIFIGASFHSPILLPE